MTRARAFRLAMLVALAPPASGLAEEPAPVGPPAPASAQDLAALRDQMNAQAAASAKKQAADEAEIARLEQLVGKLRQGDAQAVGRLESALAEERREAAGRPVVRAGEFTLALSGFIQADGTLWRQSSRDQLNPSTGAPLNDQRFLIRRARLRAQLDYSILEGAVEFDGNTVNGYQARIIGAEASVIWRNRASAVPWLMATIGSFKIPFGFEVGQRDTERLFLERSNMEHAFFPGEYDLGVRLQGGWRFLRYQVAAMNGDPIGEKAFPGRDPNESKDILGRLGIDLRVLKRLGIQAGFSGLYGEGFHSGTPTTKDTLVWRDLNEDGAVELNEIQVIPGQTATPSQNFARWAVGGDLHLVVDVPRLGELTLYGELVYATNLDRGLQPADPVALARDLRELGFYVAATQELTRWAAIGVRYDRYDPDRDANDLKNGVQVPLDQSYATLAGAATFRYRGYGRLMLEYDHNWNALGRKPNGLPTTLADDAFFMRGEVSF